MTDYTTIGNYTVVPVADLLNLVSKANRPNGDSRLHLTGLAKHAGLRVLSDDGAGNYTKVIALGDKSSDAWQIVDGSAQKKPVNILNPGGQTSWTITQTTGADDGTYVSGLLTVTTAKAALASQVVVLKAGNYRMIVTANRHDALKAVRLKAVAATDGTVVNVLLSDAVLNASGDASLTSYTIDFTLTTASQNVTFSHTIETIANTTIATGVAHISYSIEAGNNGTSELTNR